ncbi:5720_t:CDS:2 [Funneliformis geosporum]|nr:5720_t:CDS:2 [Funneliformis geosporum]
MVKTKKLNAEQYGAILYSHKQGDSYQKIADIVQCGKITVYDAIKRFKEIGSAIPKKRCGLKPPFNSNAQSLLKKIVTQNSKYHRLTTQKIQELWTKKKKKVSTVTIRRTLKKVSLQEEFDPSCLTATVKHSPSQMFWECFLWYRLGPLVPLRKSVTEQRYAKVLQRHAIPSIYKLVPHK